MLKNNNNILTIYITLYILPNIQDFTLHDAGITSITDLPCDFLCGFIEGLVTALIILPYTLSLKIHDNCFVVQLEDFIVLLFLQL